MKLDYSKIKGFFLIFAVVFAAFLFFYSSVVGLFVLAQQSPEGNHFNDCFSNGGCEISLVYPDQRSTVPLRGQIWFSGRVSIPSGYQNILLYFKAFELSVNGYNEIASNNNFSDRWCSTDILQAEGSFGFFCDSMFMDNREAIYFQPRLILDGVEQPLVLYKQYNIDPESNPYIGPFRLENSYSISMPGEVNSEGVTVVSGVGEWSGQLSGDAEEVKIFLDGQGDNYQDLHYHIDLVEVEHSSTSSFWQGNWDPSNLDLPSGDIPFLASLNFKTLSGNDMRGVAAHNFLLSLDHSSPPVTGSPSCDITYQCDQPPQGCVPGQTYILSCSNECGDSYTQDYVCPCTSGDWQCPDWPSESECVSGQTYTHECTDGCGNKMTETWLCPNSPSPDSNINSSSDNYNFNSSGPGENSNFNLNVNGEAGENNNQQDYNQNSLPALGSITVHYPEEGNVVTGEVSLKASTGGESKIVEVRFYYTEVNNLKQESPIGPAEQNISKKNSWHRGWNTNLVPNGEYLVFARAKDFWDRISISNQIKIKVDHNISVSQGQAGDSYNEIDDTDGDGISNSDEEFLGTDKNKTDTDGDGINDYNELEADTNPLNKKNLISDPRFFKKVKVVLKNIKSIKFDEPKTSGRTAPDKLKIEKVENYFPERRENNLIIKGHGPPNTWLKLYIYSDPLVVSVLTDQDGNFVYILEEELDNGRHEVYVTINSDSGKIKEKSSPLTFFIKEAQAVSEAEYMRGDINVSSSKSEAINNFLLPAALIVISILLVLAAVLVVSRKK